MNPIDKVKSKRSTIRSSISKLVNKCETVFTSDVDQTDVDTLVECLNILLEKEQELKGLDSEIDALITDKVEYEKEIKTVEEYSEKILSLKFKIKNRLKKCKADIEDKNVSESNSKTENKYESAVKLPKLCIEKFNGEISKFLDFYNTFLNAIDGNPSLSSIEKFQYLKSLLTGPAYNIVSGFELNEQNYLASLKLLKDRYGKRENVISCHMNKILNLEAVKSISNFNALKNLYDKVEVSIRNLDSLGVTSGSYGHLLLPILLKLLPEPLVLDFHRKRDPDKDPEVTELLDFIKNELRCREATNLVNSSTNKDFENYQNKNKSFPPRKNMPSAAALNTSTKQFCIFCKASNHVGISCTKFTDEQKRYKLKKEGRCYKCFLKSHLSANCRTKLNPCSKCSDLTHNYLFCPSLNKNAHHEKENTTIVSMMSEQKYKQKCTLLQTCCVFVSGRNKKVLARVLCDSGSEKCFVKKSLVKNLKVKPVRQENLLVYPFGRKHPYESCYDVVVLELNSIVQPYKSIKIEALVVESITGAIVKTVDPEILEVMKNRGYRPADTGQEEEISILLGSDFLWEIQRGIVQNLTKDLYVADTIFGHTVQGNIVSNKGGINCLRISVENVNDQLKAFWDLESIGILENNEKNSTDLEIVSEFEKNLKFLNGRYEARLLWKDSPEFLKNNLEVAKRRFSCLENKFLKNEALLVEYNSILAEQLKEGIIEVCPNEFLDNCYYMPHRPVIREDKKTTKVRIVYDASSKDNNCSSLNENLNSGPNLNPCILDIILKFRLHKVAFSADIEKAFLQIGIAEEDRDYLRFLYYDNFDSHEKIIPYRMTRATFGVTCSPFMLSCTIKHHIKGYKYLFEKVVNMLDSSLYVDDLFYGADSVNEAFVLSSGAVKILNDASMTLRKFKSNSSELRKLWKEHAINVEEDINDQNDSKILGMNWVTENDVLKIDLRPFLEEFVDKVITKCVILQTAAKIYDPVGFISPFVLRIKFLMQELWELGVNWDSPLPSAIIEKFKQWYNEIKELKTFEVPRRYFQNSAQLNPETVQIFIFCDASLKGYGSVAYIHDTCSRETAFIMSKTRVCPLKKLTLPRLELLGALTAARLAKYLRELLKISCENIFCFTDSQIVLHWLKGNASKWKPFVENRVREIQQVVAPRQWKFCKGTENPADVLSRGCTAHELLKNEMWLKGPSWINEELSITSMPEIKTDISDEEILQEKRKTIVCQVTHDDPQFELLSKFSLWTVLRRVTGWCLRFIKNIRYPNERVVGFLTVAELNEATNTIVKLVQKHEFKEELKILKSGKDLNSSNKLLPLNPFVDSSGIIRVGGRLRNARIPEGQKHQIILPKKHHVTDLIIKHFHEKHLHSGTQLTIAALRQNFWIINAREAVKKNIRSCMKCFRNTANLASQLMGDLPTARVTQSRVFSKVGVDVAGPFMIRPRKGRGVKSYKSYVCLYICFATKAVHLEILSDMSTETFLASLKRFVARRGKPEEIFSDRGSNFIGADKEIKRMMSQISSEEKFHNYLANETIKWNFNPPSAPHFGGLWEAGIKQMKNHLKRTIGEQILTYEEFLTLITQIESCLNSRPLVPISNDPSDLSVLTPGHFIIGTALTSIPEPDLSSTYLSPLERWKLLQKIFQSFWKRWSSDYLMNLQQRTKWLKVRPDLKMNDLVLIKDDNQPPLKWKLGRVIELFPGQDKIIRVVKLQTVNGHLKRPIHKLAPLPFN